MSKPLTNYGRQLVENWQSGVQITLADKHYAVRAVERAAIELVMDSLLRARKEEAADLLAAYIRERYKS